MKYEHIIWDWNGTLIDDTWLTVEIVNEILIERDLPTLLHEEYRSLFDFPIAVFNGRVGLPTEGKQLKETSLHFITEYNRRRYECSLHRDTLNTLNTIANSGTRQSILSAYPQHDLSESIEHYGLSECFAELTGQTESHGESKIDSGRDLMQRLSLPPHHVLLIGDTAHDYEVARAIRTDCILVSHGYHPPERLLHYEVPVVDSLAGIEEWIGT